MINKPKDFEMLVDAFKSLPSVGTKNAIRFAYHIIKSDNRYAEDFIKRISRAKSNLCYCKYCHNLSSSEICNICNDEQRENKLLIIDSILDLDKIEELLVHQGYYHVLHGEINPKKGIADKDIFINDIKNHIEKFGINEVLIATSFSVAGEITSEFIMKQIPNNIDVYRIGFGLPTNSSIDYSDDQTLKFALLNKRKIS